MLLQMSVTIIGAYLIGKTAIQRYFFFDDGWRKRCLWFFCYCFNRPFHPCERGRKGQIITLVNLLGTVMMLTLPFLGLQLFGGNLIEKVHFWVVHSNLLVK